MKKNQSFDNISYVTLEKIENYLYSQNKNKELKILGIPLLKIYHKEPKKSTIYLFGIIPLLSIETK